MKALAISGLGAALFILAACGSESSPPPVPVAIMPEEPAGSAQTPPSSGEAKPGDAKGDAKKDADEGAPGDEAAKPGDAPADVPGDPGAPGENGGSRIAVGEHCCFNGKYLRCPDSAACFGGFDVNDCFSKCADVDCIQTCADKLDAAGAPKGCNANAAPPPGIDCANGQMNF